MKLVVVYLQYHGDNEWVERVLPVEYSSVEDFLETFVERLKKAYSTFTICGFHFLKSDFHGCSDMGDEWFPPEVYTLEDWWDVHARADVVKKPL